MIVLYKEKYPPEITNHQLNNADNLYLYLYFFQPTTLTLHILPYVFWWTIDTIRKEIAF